MDRNNRRGSMDFYFDMYDDDDAFGRDELERLLSENDNDEYSEDPFESGEGPSTSVVGSNLKDPGLKDTSVTSKLMSWFPFFRWSDPTLHYKPSTAGLTGVVKSRTRSSTKSSTISTETYRSRGELFSDGEYDGSHMEDAQMVSDNFAASLVFAKQRASASSTNISSVLDFSAGASEEELRQEEQDIEHQEEEFANKERERRISIREQSIDAGPVVTSATDGEEGDYDEDNEEDGEEREDADSLSALNEADNFQEFQEYGQNDNTQPQPKVDP
jgi:hypothetical protein